jgi:hypothetical protein
MPFGQQHIVAIRGFRDRCRTALKHWLRENGYLTAEIGMDIGIWCNVYFTDSHEADLFYLTFASVRTL